MNADELFPFVFLVDFDRFDRNVDLCPFDTCFSFLERVIDLTFLPMKSDKIMRSESKIVILGLFDICFCCGFDSFGRR